MGRFRELVTDGGSDAMAIVELAPGPEGDLVRLQLVLAVREPGVTELRLSPARAQLLADALAFAARRAMVRG